MSSGLFFSTHKVWDAGDRAAPGVWEYIVSIFSLECCINLGLDSEIWKLMWSWSWDMKRFFQKNKTLWTQALKHNFKMLLVHSRQSLLSDWLRLTESLLLSGTDDYKICSSGSTKHPRTAITLPWYISTSLECCPSLMHLIRFVENVSGEPFNY